jgi:hypothetical protein
MRTAPAHASTPAGHLTSSSGHLHAAGPPIVSGLSICTHDHDQRQRSLHGLALTRRHYPVGLTAAKPFRSPI